MLIFFSLFSFLFFARKWLALRRPVGSSSSPSVDLCSLLVTSHLRDRERRCRSDSTEEHNPGHVSRCLPRAVPRAAPSGAWCGRCRRARVLCLVAAGQCRVGWWSAWHVWFVLRWKTVVEKSCQILVSLVAQVHCVVARVGRTPQEQKLTLNWVHKIFCTYMYTMSHLLNFSFGLSVVIFKYI